MNQMDTSSYLLCLVLTVLIVLPASWSFDCVTPTKDPNAPHLPSIPGLSYWAHIELNILDKNETFSIEEFLDYEGNRAARTTYRDDSMVKYIYSYKTDEIFTLQDGSCTVTNMSSPEGQQLMVGTGSFRLPDEDRRHVFGTAATFRYAKDKSDYFAGKDLVRGIPAYKWATCIPTGNTTKMQVTYYFNVNDWKMQVSGVSLPLRIEVEGTARNRGGGAKGTHYFHHNYDFINYQPTIPDPVHFQLPEEAICLGRVSTKDLPTFSKTFRYSGESIDDTYGSVMHFAVWYDGLSKLVRIDKRDQVQLPPVFTLNPVTEVHDYTLGVRYIRDNVLGNCTIYPLGSDSADASTGPQKTISMRDPGMFFHLNQDFIYSGQRTVRGIVCDVFSAIIPNYNIDGTSLNCTFHYYFLSDSWDDLPLQDGTTNVQKYPVMLEILAAAGDVPINKKTNFFDFDDSEMFDGVFDVSECFDEGDKLNFRVVFPGTYYPATEKEWKHFVHYKLSDVIKIPPTRIGNLVISANLHNVFVSGSILGTTASAQFQVLSQGSTERKADKSFPGIKLQTQCADLCIKNPDFLCQGYQYCADTQSCGLSKTHVMSQSTITGGKNCGVYTRTVVKSDVKEPTLSEAFQSLKVAVQSRKLNIGIQNPDGFTANFQAIDVQLLSGYPSKTKPMPPITSRFSYRMETTVPQFQLVFESYVWYDSERQLVRLDSRDQSPVTVTEYSIISDFNTGVNYKINKVTNHCQIMPISSTYDLVNTFASKADKDGGLKIKMKSPLQVFYMDQSYTYMGQKTVRGILCDAFQATRSDFHIKTFNLKSENSIFTLYFQAEPWKYYTADSLDVTSAQPVQLTIEDASAQTYLTYNIFDYNDETHTIDYYDISTCFSADQTKSFQIIFKNQPYHPYLDELETTFKIGAILKMQEVTQVTTIHFQGVTVSHDESNIYIMVTALGAVSPEYIFQPVSNVTLNPTGIAKAISASSYQDCAAACAEVAPNPCLSFDFCPDVTNPKCLLLTSRDESSSLGQVDTNGICTHYSRSVDQNFPMLPVEQMYQDITDLVYSNSFNITLFSSAGKAKTYIATDIRDDIKRSTDPDSASGSLLNQFGKMLGKTLPDSVVVETHPMVSITDCAVSCVTSTSLHCQSFDFNFATGTCRLSDRHMDEIAVPLKLAEHINTYGAYYTRDYKRQDGYVFSDQPDKSVAMVSSSELCARSCNEQSDFRCESFEYCPNDKTCNLRKGHTLPTNQQHPGKTPSCLHYSREHLYDYTKSSNHFITGHDDLIVTVGSDSECARLCATGELAGCASFEMCQVSRGITQCRLSQADPTIQSDLPISVSRQCNLYIKSNSAQKIKPSPPQSQTSTTPQVNPSSQSKPTASTSVNGKQASSSNSDTGTRVGIAFGTLFLGLLLGAAGMFLFSKLMERKKARGADSQQLKEF